MRKMEMPPYLVSDVIESCVASIRDQDLCDRLSAAVAVLDEAETQYLNRAEESKLHVIKPTLTVNGDINRAEMSRVYDSTFAKKGSSVRTLYYDLIKLAAAHGVCPFCGQRDVSTLDHYLSKGRHPLFAVTPINLAPSCGDCNLAKSTYGASEQEEQLLHPYFDDVDDDTWLVAVVVSTDPVALNFSVRQNDDLPPILMARLNNHFDYLDLNALYTAHSGRLISDIKIRIIDLFAKGGADEVRHHLLEEAATRCAVAKNSWQVASYSALAASDSFCNNPYHIT